MTRIGRVTNDHQAFKDKPLDGNQISRQQAAGALAGGQFGNYQATDLLGAGTMGEVYLGVHPEINRKVAIKVLWQGAAGGAALESRFLEEARAISSIDHPNVVQIFDFGRLSAGHPYYIMEYLSGCPLSQAMGEAGKYTARQALPYVRQICAGLQVVHDLGIVHRDLKPGNIFVDDQTPPGIKLLDFGLAKVMSSERDETDQGVVLGTPVVIAPEQVAGQPEQVGPATDIYSLGVIIFWMLAGRPPFDDQSPGILLARHLKDPAPDLAEVEPGVPREIARLVARCLEKSPAARPGSAAGVAERFAQIVQGSVDSTLPLTGGLGPVDDEPELTAADLSVVSGFRVRGAAGRVALALLLLAGLAASLWVGLGQSPSLPAAADQEPAAPGAPGLAPVRRSPGAKPAAAATAAAEAAPRPASSPSAAPAAGIIAGERAAPPAPRPKGARAGARSPVGASRAKPGAKIQPPVTRPGAAPDAGRSSDHSPESKEAPKPPTRAGEGTVDPYQFPLPGGQR